ncbi:hypothetical protein BDV10DRAFT_160111 [Aspergillus recurvatus]
MAQLPISGVHRCGCAVGSTLSLAESIGVSSGTDVDRGCLVIHRKTSFAPQDVACQTIDGTLRQDPRICWKMSIGNHAGMFRWIYYSE